MKKNTEKNKDISEMARVITTTMDRDLTKVQEVLDLDINDLIKDESDNPTIGLILCKNKDKFIAQYALKDVNKPIGISLFKLKEYLPTEEDLNMYIDLEND